MDVRPGYKQTEVGVIPEDWEVRRLKQLTLDMLQGVNTAIDRPEYVLDGIPMLKANNIIDGEVIFEGADHISRKTFSNYSDRFRAKKNDFMFSNIGARLGTGSLLKQDIECSFAWNVMRIVPDTRKVTPEYLGFLINSPKYSQEIRSYQSGSGMGFVPKGVMQGLVVTLPKRLEEQRTNVVKAWALALSPRVDTIISLLWKKPNNVSEFKFYASLGEPEDFPTWIAAFFDVPVLVLERRTTDRRAVPTEVVEAIKNELPTLLAAGRRVVIIDSAGAERTGAVCRALGAQRMNLDDA